MNRWRARDPVMRFLNMLLTNDWWDAQQEKDLRLSLRKEVSSDMHSTEHIAATSLTMVLLRHHGHIVTDLMCLQHRIVCCHVDSG